MPLAFTLYRELNVLTPADVPRVRTALGSVTFTVTLPAILKMSLKTCTTCKKELPATTTFFHKEKTGTFGLYSICKSCNNLSKAAHYQTNKDVILAKARIRYPLRKAYMLGKQKEYQQSGQRRTTEARYRRNHRQKLLARNALRRAFRLHATPAWVDKKALQTVYMTCPVGFHVDHIVPLLGTNVCGLHVPHNLQHLPAIENLRKSNRLLERA